MAGFYNAQQACAKLKKTDEELRKLVRDGQLREFRDAKGPAYKSDEVDALVAVLGGGPDEITLMDSSAGEPAVKEKPPRPGEARGTRQAYLQERQQRLFPGDWHRGRLRQDGRLLPGASRRDGG